MSPEATLSKALYWFAKTAVHGLLIAYNDMRVYGRRNIPPGPCVLAPNHRSYIDTPVQAGMPMRLNFMGKHVMWENPAVGWLLTAWGGFPVVREGADRKAVDEAVARLKAATQPLLVFPEGERKDGPVVHPLQPGAVFLAAKAGVPIVPVGIGGTAEAMPRGARFMYPKRIRIVIGQPIDPPAPGPSGRVPRSAITQTSEQLRDAIQVLFDEAQALAGNPQSGAGE